MMDEEISLPSVNWFREKSQACFKNDGRINYKDNNLRPPYSYSQIIVYAFIHYGYRKLSLSDIYTYFIQEYGYFRNNTKSWKNSVRHLLSLDKRFIKIPREKGEKGKGAYWLLDRSTVNYDGTLKQTSITKQSRNMPIIRAKKDKPDPNVKPHINPFVVKYIKQLKSSHKVSKISDIIPETCYQYNEDDLTFDLSRNDSENDIIFDYSLNSRENDESIDNIMNISDDNDLYIIDFNDSNLDFSSPVSIDDFFKTDFIDESIDEYQFQ